MRLGDLDALKDNMFHYAAPEMVWDRGDIEHKINEMPTIDAIPVEWLQDMARRTEAQAEPHFAFMYVLHEWQESKPIEVLQAESEMRDWKKEQEAQDGKRDYEAAVEMAEYCERYEPTYNAEDGSM